MTKIAESLLSKKPTSHRQLRVGEEIRRIVAQLVMRGDLRTEQPLDSITITHADVSPDLKNATIYIMPLGGEARDEALESLQGASKQIRHQLSKELRLKFIPNLKFTLDTSFDQAQRIEELLKS